MAMETGTSAPAPSAWKTRIAISHDSWDVRATATEKTINNAMDMIKTRRCPHTSETLPMSGIAAT